MQLARRRSLAVGVAALLAALVVVGIDSAAEARHDVARVRAATAKFHRLSTAEGAGYALLTDAGGISCIEGPDVDDPEGGMGTHFVNGDLVADATIDAERPEALLYDLTGRHPRLLGVEYVVLVADWGEVRDPPRLFGQEFTLVEEGNRYGLPPFYELHAWIWKPNPAGMFDDWNARISC